jgi:hypothetical protein
MGITAWAILPCQGFFIKYNMGTINFKKLAITGT